MACHLGRLFETHYREHCGSDIGEASGADVGVFALGDVDTGHGVERVGRVGRSVGVLGVVGVAVVGNDDYLVAGFLGGFDGVADAEVDGFDGFLDGFVDSGVADHVAVGIVDDDEVEFLRGDGFDEFVPDLESAHFGLEVIGGYFGRGDENALFAGVGLFAAAVEEECHVGVFLGLGYVELFLAELREIFAEGVDDVLLVEEDVNPGERGIVGGHAEILQSCDGLHSGLGHIVLGQHGGQLFGAVVAVVEEDYGVVLCDETFALGERGIVDRLYEFVGNAVGIALLNSSGHVGGLGAGAGSQQVVGLLDALPALVAVHGVVAAYDRGDAARGLGHVLFEAFDEAFARVRVGVTAVHEAVDIDLLQAVVCRDVEQCEEMVEA